MLRQRLLRILLGNVGFGGIRQRVNDLNARPGQFTLEALNTVFRVLRLGIAHE